MQKVTLEMTDSLLAAIEQARGAQKFGPFVEAALWNSPSIRNAAKRAGIERAPRTTPGRPWPKRRKGSA